MAPSVVLKDHSASSAPATDRHAESRLAPGRQAADRASSLGVCTAIAVLLLIHASLLAYSATRHSPTMLEPASLVGGISHWQFGRYDLYHVNPPLVKMLAALPVLIVGCETDWDRFYDGPGARCEFAVGADFIAANNERTLWLFTLARWACIPLSVLGGLVCYLWARDLYGEWAGRTAVALWSFDPSALAHGQLITTDMAATSLGLLAGYAFWRWLRASNWSTAIGAGTALGFAELAKTSWCVLFALWPLLWVAWRCSTRTNVGHTGKGAASSARRPRALQMALVVGVGLLLVNLGYGFDGAFKRLGAFPFVSEMLSGNEHRLATSNNRFADSYIGGVRLPLPEHYVLGLDSQQRDFERFNQPSYLRGEWRHGGWWYYYIYGWCVKVPHGTQLLLLAAVLLRPFRCGGSTTWRDESVLLVPGIVLFALVSSQTSFNHHVRYVLPSFGPLLVFVSSIAASSVCSRQCRATVLSCALASVISSLCAYPHSLSYFNEVSGGQRNGHAHIAGSSLDWGQDLVFLQEWLVHNRRGGPFTLISGTRYDPHALGIQHSSAENALRDGSLAPGLYAVSESCLISPRQSHRPDAVLCRILRSQRGSVLVGASIRVFYIAPHDAGMKRSPANTDETNVRH